MFIQNSHAQEVLEQSSQEVCCPSGGDCCWTNNPFLFHSIWIVPILLFLLFFIGVTKTSAINAAKHKKSVRVAQRNAQLLGILAFLLSLFGLHLGIHKCLFPTGTFDPYPYEQFWENPVDPPTDILFAVDQSCSMNDDVIILGEQFNEFIHQLSTYSSNWQIMVVNDDDGCNRGSILTPQTPNYQQLFLEYVKSFNAKSDSSLNLSWPKYSESLLTMSAIALENTDDQECNSGFIRKDSLLHVIMVSDYEDSSENPWNHYVDKMIQKKGGKENLRLSAISGDIPDGCKTEGNSASGGQGYWEAVQETEGQFLSICSNWTSSQNLKELAEASVILHNYPLENQAAEDTIVVFVNETQVFSDWHYDSVRNSVIFDSNAPVKGDKIRIQYSCCPKE